MLMLKSSLKLMVPGVPAHPSPTPCPRFDDNNLNKVQLVNLLFCSCCGQKMHLCIDG